MTVEKKHVGRKIALASVHRLAEHLHAMSTQKSRYKISDYSRARSSVPRKIPLMYVLFKSWTVGSCRFQIHLCVHSCMRNEPWIHTRFSCEISTSSVSLNFLINLLIESFWGKLDLLWLLTLDFVCLLLYLQYRPVQTDAPTTGAANIGGLNFFMPFRENWNTNTSKQIWMSTKAELFPGESILRFIHQSQHQKLFASWHWHYNQSEAVPNIPGKREHDYRWRFTDVSSPDFCWGRGDVCAQAVEVVFLWK